MTIYMLREVQNTALVVTMIGVGYVASRDGHVSGAESMRHQFKNSSPVFITPESKEFKLGKTKRKQRIFFFTTFCKHERRQNMADRNAKIWQKKK